MSLFESASLVVTPNGTKASKLYAIKPTDGSGDLTVTRATTARRVNSAGLISSVANNVPRLDYLNSTCPSVLVEPQRTNLQTYSEDFSNVVFIKSGATVSSNVAVSPDGNTTADKLIEDTSNGGHSTLIAATQAIGGDYTFSVFVKASGRTKFQLAEAFSIGGTVNFDLTAGTVTTTAPAKNGKIENYGNGWFRCSATWTFLGATNTVLYLNLLNDAGSNSYLGNGTSGVNLWGAQLEAGSYSTSYIPTTTASVTRNADVISKTGISSLIGQTEGTVYLECEADITNSNGAILVYLGSSDGSGAFDYSTYIKFNSNNLNLTVYSGGVLYVNSNSTETYTNKQKIKVAFCYKNNDFICYANGIQLFTDTLGTVSTNLSSIALGHYPPNIPFNQYNGSFKNINVWKTRLTNAELAALTTL